MIAEAWYPSRGLVLVSYTLKCSSFRDDLHVFDCMKSLHSVSFHLIQVHIESSFIRLVHATDRNMDLVLICSVPLIDLELARELLKDITRLDKLHERSGKHPKEYTALNRISVLFA